MSLSQSEITILLSANKNVKIIGIEHNIEEIMQQTRNLYWSILEAKSELDSFDQNYSGVLEVASSYLSLSQQELAAHSYGTCICRVCSHGTTHKVNQSRRRAGVSMSALGTLPIIEFTEIRKAWNDFLDCSNAKLLFVFLGSIITLVFGAFTVLSWAFLVLTIIHFVMRLVANSKNGRDDYISFSRNVQLFLWSYLLLAIGRILSLFVEINGLPEGSFYAIYQVLLISGELKGIIKIAEEIELPVPEILKRIASNSKMKPPL